MQIRKVLGSLELLVMLALMKGRRAASAEEINRRIKEAGGPSRLGGVHTTVIRLRKGPLVSHRVDSSANLRAGSPQVFYSITESGRACVKRYLKVIGGLTG